jgi:molecular chaperone GrpE
MKKVNDNITKPTFPRTDLGNKVAELTADLQRIQADFENYRKQADAGRELARQAGREEAILKLLPVIDNIERATDQIPPELDDNDWAKGILNLRRNLETVLSDIGITKIVATSGTTFDPNLHDAVQFDDDSDGSTEIVAAELQPGYLLNGIPLRHAMVRVAKQ